MTFGRVYGKFFPLGYLFAIIAVFSAHAAETSPVISQEVSDEDGIPVLIKHLPAWESVYHATTFTNKISDIRAVLGDRAVFDVLEFMPGTEAVTAPYGVGRLLIIEYPTPQASVHADGLILQNLAEQPANPHLVVYRRIGNYNAFVFDAPDPVAAAALLDQVKYQKTVLWLGGDPYLLERIERYFAMTGRDVAISTVLWIFTWAGIAVFVGIISGLLFFRYRENQRLTRTAFSDAGGLTRLNLDGLSEPLNLKH
jgi:hypothetical protein